MCSSWLRCACIPTENCKSAVEVRSLLPPPKSESRRIHEKDIHICVKCEVQTCLSHVTKICAYVLYVFANLPGPCCPHHKPCNTVRLPKQRNITHDVYVYNSFMYLLRLTCASIVHIIYMFITHWCISRDSDALTYHTSFQGHHTCIHIYIYIYIYIYI